MAHRHGIRLSQAFGLGRLGRSMAHRLVSAGLVVGLLLATRAAALLWGVMSAAAGWGPPVRGEFTEVFGTGGGGLLLAVLMVVLAGPFVEELTFRGVVLGAVGPRWGMWPAIVASAGLFALAHVTAWALVPTFVLGIALGWLAWTRGLRVARDSPAHSVQRRCGGCRVLAREVALRACAGPGLRGRRVGYDVCRCRAWLPLLAGVRPHPYERTAR